MKSLERRLSKLENSDGCLCDRCSVTTCIRRRIEEMTEDEIDMELGRLLQIIKDDAPTPPPSSGNR
jgi:hypothetical protein